MKKLFLVLVMVILLAVCAPFPKTGLLVRYPMKGEVVDVYSETDGSTLQFVIDYEDLEQFLDQKCMRRPHETTMHKEH